LGVLQVTPARTGRGEEAVADPCFSGVLCGGAWVHASPVAVARGGDAPPLFLLSSGFTEHGPSTAMDF